MEIFDDITVPKSYLKGLLTKKQEKFIKNNVHYQTKSLENFLGQYKVYRQKLYVKSDKWDSGKNGDWKRDTYSGKVNFYTSYYDKDINTWWVEFNFFFIDGVLDKRELVKFEMRETAEEAKKRVAKREAFEKTFKYRFYEKIRVFLSPILEWVEKHTRQ
jgi:hypothetical protein